VLIVHRAQIAKLYASYHHRVPHRQRAPIQFARNTTKTNNLPLPTPMDTLCISVSQASKLLGISKRSLYSYIEVGLFPALRIGRRILIRRADIEHMLKPRS
jgi:excisionase family DNA binding protein